MKLYEGKMGKSYVIIDTDLPFEMTVRLQTLGMIKGTKINIKNRKNKGAMVINVRGSRFALGESITKGIEVGEIDG